LQPTTITTKKFSKDIAYVVILGPTQEKRRAIRAVATQDLDWRIMPEGGGDVIDAQPYPTSDISAHQRLRSIKRVQNAIDQ
jgi:hypothetical protein